MGKLNKRGKYVITIIILSLVIGIFFYWQNNGLTITKISYENNKIPENFNGFKIVQLSDLHNKEFGKNQEKLVKKVKAESPDIIIFTGDLIDHSKGGDGGKSFIDTMKDIAPIFFVTGNHEAWSSEYSSLVKELREKGVTVLNNIGTKVERDGKFISILGIDDPAFIGKENREGSFEEVLEKLVENEENNNFKILLSHRPELMDFYVANKLDLVFTGHVHGGQFRIPFLGGVLAPNRSLFPKYTSGMHTIETTSMIINRGLGNSIIPVRIFNRPEIVSVTFKA